MKQFDIGSLPLNGIHLLEASAGTGKTWTIARIYLRLLLEAKLSIDEILVMTYTVAATNELKTRLRNTLLERLNTPPELSDENKKRLRIALHGFERAQILTLHGFAGMVLSGFALESGSPMGLKVCEGENARLLIEETAADFWRREIAGLPLKRFNHIGPNVSPEAIVSLLRGGLLLESAHFEPTLPDASIDLEQLEENSDKTWHYTKGTWEREGEQVRHFIETSKDLKRSHYQRRWLSGFWSVLNETFGESFPHDIDTVKLGKLTRKFLISQLKSTASLPNLAFWDDLSSFLDSFLLLSNAYVTETMRLRAKAIKECQMNLEKRHKSLSVQTFDGLLKNVQRGLSNPGLFRALQSRFKAALIDEFQDTDSIQFDILKKLFANQERPFYLIGDPKQAIYQFRGADLATYFSIKRIIPNPNQHTLSRNYRSHPELVNTINALFEKASKPFILDELQFQPVVPANSKEKNQLLLNGLHVSGFALQELKSMPGNVLSIDEAKTRITSSIASSIAGILRAAEVGQAFLDKNPVSAGHIAILTNTNKEAAQLHDALVRFGIPSTILADESIFETDESFILSLLLRAVLAPSDTKKVRAFLLSTWGGYSLDTLNMLEKDALQWNNIFQTFAKNHSLWQESGLAAVLSTFNKEFELFNTLARLPEGQRKITNLMHLAEILSERELVDNLHPSALFQWFEHQRSNMRLESHSLRMDRSDEAVKILTIHKSKGLEFPIVFCPFLWTSARRKDEHFFYHNTKGELIFNLGTPDEKAQQHHAKETLAEKMRLLYVALTRASSACFVTIARTQDYEKSGLGYLLKEGLPPNLSIEPLPEIKGPPISEFSPISHDLQPAYFTGSVHTKFSLFSFSSLTRTSQHKAPEEFSPASDETNAFPALPEEKVNFGILGFPKGANAGSCIHAFLEQLDFQETDNTKIVKLAEKTCLEYGLPEHESSRLVEMTKILLATPLLPDQADFTLNKIPLISKKTEMGFNFPSTSICPSQIRQQLTGWGKKHLDSAQSVIPAIDFREGYGYFQGFIDLVFEFQDRFYILDWKSNHLGIQQEDYSPNSIKKAMFQSAYPLQYYIYTVALVRYLRSKIRNFDYNKHFGGVFYLFLRGISYSSGIFFDKPPQHEIMTLENIFSEQEN